jgi:KDO2-lipid IV(A) lauroyltransferase
MVTEIVHLPRKLHLNNYNHVITFRNRGIVLRAFASQRPVILLSGHFGNWEMAISVFGLFGFPMGVIARRLDNPYLHEWFRCFREYTGHDLILKKGAFQQISARLQAGNSVALLGDQDAGPRGIFVDFFGREAATFKSIALLAIEHQALICVGYARRLADNPDSPGWVRYELGCEDVVDPLDFTGDDPVRNVTQRYTDALERVIRRAPEQYFWVHRRWKTSPLATRAQREPQHRKAG